MCKKPQKPYIPTPTDTAGIELSDKLMQLVELLSQNTHEVWAKGRMDEGWVWGPVRNDELKQHPCLIPYAELPENEKEYDRNTSLETLKMILKLGWKIEKI